MGTCERHIYLTFGDDARLAQHVLDHLVPARVDAEHDVPDFGARARFDRLLQLAAVGGACDLCAFRLVLVVEDGVERKDWGVSVDPIGEAVTHHWMTGTLHLHPAAP
jgi:hypothetical protein